MKAISLAMETNWEKGKPEHKAMEEVRSGSEEDNYIESRHCSTSRPVLFQGLDT